MYQTLNCLLQKPVLYDKTQEKFWNDPHISKGMLDAHLNPNTDSASRRPEYIEASAAWIASLLPDNAKLLDIGCGPGLYTKRLSEYKLLVTGLDFSERSITYAREHDKKSQYIVKNYLEMNFENMFDIVTLIWCDYGALIPEDRYTLLSLVYRALKPGGMFLFDVFTPAWNKQKSENTSWEVSKSGGFWSPKAHICLNAEYLYGKNVNMHRHVIIEEKAIRCFNVWNTCFTQEALSEEFAPYDLKPDSFFADVKGTPYFEDSLTLCALMKKQ
ncbi:MAG: class I SAM-dependent methyltransferase [Clostridiaceae bacterium]|nr:class I SAM-dependent methyltransferase [Clostridiaceae bacterium]